MNICDKCRVCLNKLCSNSVNLESNYTRNQKLKLLECLRHVTQLEIPLACGSIQMPRNVCLRCSKALQVAYHFIELACDSDAALQRQFHDVEKQENSSNDHDIETEVTQSSSLNYNSEFCEFVKQVDKTVDNKTPQNRIQQAIKAEKEIADDAEGRNSLLEANVDLKSTAFHIYDAASEDNSHRNKENYKESHSVDCLCDVTSLASESYVTDENAARPIDTENQPQPQNTKDDDDDKHSNSTTGNNSKFVEEIKENLKNVARDLLLQRNKSKMLADTKELEKAIELRQAEVNDNHEIVCIECQESFNDMQLFLRHRNRHQGITPFRCSKCNYFTCYRESLRKHYKREHNIEATNEMLNKIIDNFTASAEKPYNEVTFNCTQCSFETHKEDNIRAHFYKQHLKTNNFDDYFTKAFNCPDCYRSFKDQGSMRKHFTLMHGVSMGIRKVSFEKISCDKCGKQFQFRISLRNHQQTCSKRPIIDCYICAKKFSVVGKFERHLRVEHSVETIHECEICKKPFKSPANLYMHRKRHSERHFQCDFCPRNYINNSELKTHMERIHATSPKAVCKICKQSFASYTLLREHTKKTHSKRSIKCAYCNFKSISSYQLQLHQFEHRGKPYKCDICSKEFIFRAEMRRHARNVHQIQLSEEQLGAMYLKKFGYPSRHDAFSQSNNSLEITDITPEDIEMELKEYGLKFDDIVKDLFNGEAMQNLV